MMKNAQKTDKYHNFIGFESVLGFKESLKVLKSFKLSILGHGFRLFMVMVMYSWLLPYDFKKKVLMRTMIFCRELKANKRTLTILL